MNYLKDHSVLLGTIKNYVSIITFSFGFVGNLLAFLVFSCKKFQNTIFSTYFRCLCLFDFLYLIIAFLQILSFDIKIVHLFSVSNFSCKILSYFSYFIAAISAWTMVIISLDRMFSIVWPSRFLFRKKSINQIVIIVGMFIFNTIYWSPVLFLADLKYIQNETNQTGRLKCIAVSSLLSCFELINISVVPFSLMIISTILTLIKIFKSRKRQSSSVKSKDIKFAITSISLNIIFLVLNLPVTMLVLFTNSVEELDRLLLSVLSLMFQCNYSLVFYVNLIVNSLFRKEFYKLIKQIKISIQYFLSNYF